MRGFLRKLIVALSIILVSTYSFNAQTTRDQNLIKLNFERGLRELKVLNYRDALIFFSRAYIQDPYSYYGELSYLYIGKSYALYSYGYRSRQGILASIGYLNQYPFHYKVPRFINTQREFIADSYLLLQWYDDAKNIYANLYGETEKKEYLIKLGYATALSGSIENFNYIKDLAKIGVPKDYLDFYYMTLAFYYFNIGKFKTTLELLSRAININPYLREDPHVLFRLGISYNKLGDWRRALLYLELALRNDAFGVYEERSLYYLALINLETNNFREAYLKAQELFKDDRLFYRKLPQILFSTFWYYDEFIKVYGKEIGNYREKLLKVGWLNVENIFGDLPALGIYYLSMKGRSLTEEERKFLKAKKLRLTEFVYENDIFTFDKYLNKLREELGRFVFYKAEDASYLTDVYKTNPDNFATVFGTKEGWEILARSLTYTGDELAVDVIPRLENKSLYWFLGAQIHILKNRPVLAVNFLERSLQGLRGDDRTEAQLLLYFLRDDRERLENVVLRTDFQNERFGQYSPIIYLKLGDLSFAEKDYRSAIEYYKKVIEMGEKVGEGYWWALFRTALSGELMRSEKTIKWVVKKAEEKDNIWSRVILTLWEG